MDIRSYLRKNVLLFDGAMGTYYARRFPKGEACCERANLTAPDDIAAIHRAYIEAGSRAVKTNTFGVDRIRFSADEAEAMLRAGYDIAVRAAEDAFVFADIGPMETDGGRDPAEEYIFLADVFLGCGARHFLFETNGRDDGLREAAAYIKERDPEAFVLVSFAAQPDGFTRAGLRASELIRAAAADGSIDIEQVKTMVDLFMAAGSTYFDTAFVYEGSEEATREALL